jgi:hypothetical protein
MKNGPDSWVKIFLIGLKIGSMSEFTDATLPKPCRLATQDELKNLWETNPGILQDEDNLIIVGERVRGFREADDIPECRHCIMTNKGVNFRYILADKVIDDNYLFAVTFDSVKK